MAETIVEEQPASFVTPMGGARLLQVVALGAVVGLAVWALSLSLDRYIFQLLLCRDVEAAQCTVSAQYAEAVASIIGIGVGLYFLVKIQIFRPLLVSLAATASLWGIINFTQQLPWYGVGLATIGLYALAYAAYAWTARLRAFWLAALMLLVFIVAIRLILSS